MQRIQGNYLRNVAAQASSSGGGRYTFRHSGPGSEAWWTQTRLARLVYIVDRWGDYQKAGRVLGCNANQCRGAFEHRLTDADKAKLRTSKDYRP